MKEHPILFSAPMVRAILDGRKTQTRRVVNPQPSAEWSPVVEHYCPTRVDRNGEEYPGAEVFGAADESEGRPCPYGAPGHPLWVREAHAIVPSSAYRLSRDDDGNLIPHRVSDDGYYWCVYREGWSRSRPSRWSPSIHMPRWASRLTLEVVSVRVEPVQEISEEDAVAEGIDQSEELTGGGDRQDYQRDYSVTDRWFESDPISSYRTLWDSINGKKPGCSWADNPWCWVIEFKRVSQ